MDRTTKATDLLFPQRPLRQIVANRPAPVHAIAPGDTVLAALKAMADAGTGFLVVLDQRRLVGVISERDYARKVVLEGRVAADTRVADIMTREVVTVRSDELFGDCMRLMDRHRIRHLPVVDGERVVAVISVRDLLREAVAHHERVVAEVERERMTIFNSTF